MNSVSTRAAILTVIAAFGAALLATPSAALQQSSSLSILHVADGLPETEIVDVYAGSMRIIDDLRPGELRGVRITSGRYEVRVFPDGQDPRTASPLARIEGLRLLQDANVTVAIHPGPDGRPRATDFNNSLLRNPRGQGRVTIRHVALAPALDVQLGELRSVRSVNNSDEITIRGLLGDQFAEIRQSDTATVLVSPRRIPIARPINTVLYIWGSAPDQVRIAVQPIPVGLS